MLLAAVSQPAPFAGQPGGAVGTEQAALVPKRFALPASWRCPHDSWQYLPFCYQHVFHQLQPDPCCHHSPLKSWEQLK